MLSDRRVTSITVLFKKPARVEYVERQPSLEDVFLAIVGHDRTTHWTTAPDRADH